MWSSRHWVPEIWTWLYSLKSQKAKYVSPHFHIIMENLYFFQTAQARYVTSLLEHVIEGHGWFWLIFLLFWYQWYYCCFLKLLVMKIYLKVWWKLYFQENPFHFIIVFFLKLLEMKILKVGESCISKKTHFHFLFDYLWNEHRRWEFVANSEERINKNHGIVV